MKRDFTNYAEWKAAVEAAGFTIDRTPAHEGMHASDLTDPVIAVNKFNHEVGMFHTYKDDFDIMEDYSGGALSEKEADEEWEKLPWISEGILFNNPTDFDIWKYRDVPEPGDLSE